MFSSRQRLDATSLDELGQRGFADPDVTADLDELDPPFRDQSADETNRRAHPLCGGLHGQQPPACPRRRTGSSCRPPDCRRIGPRGMPARRLASASAACHRARSATACSSRRAWSMWSGSAGRDGFPGVAGRVGCRNTERASAASPCGRRGGRPASCRTTCGRPAPGARRSRGDRRRGPCPCTGRGPGRAGRSWAGCRTAASSRRSASTAGTAAPRPAGPRAPAAASVSAWWQSADLLGQVLGQVADAPGRVLRSGEHALGVEPDPEPGHVPRLILVGRWRRGPGPRSAGSLR